jgi:hypothetical protein
MIWIDFLLMTRVTADELRAALTRCLNVSEASVAVVSEMGDAPPSVAIVAELSPSKGDFALHISLYVTKAILATNPIPFLLELSRDLNTSILTSDDSADPYSMLLVTAEGAPATVSLDVQSIDERDEYKLVPN